MANMENEQIDFSVEYQDTNGVVFYRNVKAEDVAEAKQIMNQLHPEAIIRAVSLVPNEVIGNN
ncbi:hypothetical protein [Paenibacillus lupini]|uniref:hypothetical protein n=1 Tax=Paenibacillus lupini TaxID=1450204 RepID=UPI001421A40A|nr:hypothetical protein [Paenibacillus lupini]NIK21865.1 hypothetical protein [Paenibacillus lupini]